MQFGRGKRHKSSLIWRLFVTAGKLERLRTFDPRTTLAVINTPYGDVTRVNGSGATTKSIKTSR